MGGRVHFPSTKIETKCVSKLHREWTRDRFFARLHHSTRELRACDSSRGRRGRVCLHTDDFRPVRMDANVSGKAKKKPRAQFSDSASRTLNVLKYVVAFFGPFWRNPRVNIFLVPCLRPLLRARWLPMVRRRLLFCEEEEDGVWKEGGGGTVFSPFFSKSGCCCFRVFWKEGRKDTQKKEDTIRVLDLKRRAKKVFHIFLRLIILLAMSTEILDRFFTQTKGIIRYDHTTFLINPKKLHRRFVFPPPPPPLF